jgi:hypothetical protein
MSKRYEIIEKHPCVETDHSLDGEWMVAAGSVREFTPQRTPTHANKRI